MIRYRLLQLRIPIFVVSLAIIYSAIFYSMLDGAIYARIMDDNQVTDVCDSIEILDSKPKLPKNFSYVYERFKIYNPDIDSNTVILFNRVCEHYRLDTTKVMLDWCVGQILLESGAKQYYETGHRKEGILVKSSAGAIGFSQIMPATAYGYLSKYLTYEDGDCMLELGCTSFSFIDSINYRLDGINKSRDWITNIDNNIILWGYIMRTKLDKYPNILKVLVSYNTGPSGMFRYISRGGSLSNHKYIRGIKTRLKDIERKLVSP